MNRKELGRTPNRTTSYSPAGVTLFGDPVAGIFQASDNSTWLHIRLSRPRAAYFARISSKFAPAAELSKCGDGYEGCYVELKDDGGFYSLRSFDLSTFRGQSETDGEPDGDYLVCLYR